MKTPFLDYWTSRKERQEFLEQRGKTKLTPAQLSTLHSDSDVRAALQKSRVASLLPPVGTEVFRRLTPTSIKKSKDSKKKKQVEEDSGLKPTPELESEKTLPFFYGVPSPELRNVPLEDPDPFYQSQKTFVVVDSGNRLSRFNADPSFFHLSPFGLFRRTAIKILNHKLFTALLCVALLVNILFLIPGLFDNKVVSITNFVFLSIYTFEAVLKIISRGFCVGRFTYLRDSWNRLDFVIILTGFNDIFIAGLEFFRVLRVIKILGLFPATRRTAKTFGRVLNRLWDVFLLTLLVISLFSIIGTGLMQGSLRNKCVMKTWGSNYSDMYDPTDSPNSTEEPFFDYQAYINDGVNQYHMPGHLDALVCGNFTDSSKCPEGYICLKTSTSPNYGFTNFDNFGYSFLSTFRLMMRDFWENLGHLGMQAKGKTIMMYFALVLFLCSFSLTAFIISAFTISFTEQTEREINEAKQDQRDLDMILTALKDKAEDELPEKKDSEEKTSCLRRTCSWDCSDCWVRLKKGLQVFVLDPFFDLAIIILLILNVLFMSTEHYPMTEEFEETLAVANLAFTSIFLLEVVLKILAMGPYDFFEVKWHYFDTFIVVMSFVELGMGDVEGLAVLRVVRLLRLFRLARWWPGFLKWMRLVWAGLRSLWLLSLALIVLFFSLFGVHLFAESYAENVCEISVDCNRPRWHYGSFFHSFMVVTRALGGEWIETMWDCLGTSSGFVCVVFTFTLLFVGNFLILTVLFTLLMKWINGNIAPKDEEKLKTSIMRIIKMLKACGINAGGKAKEEEPVAVENPESVALSGVTTEQTEENGTQSSTLPIGEAQNFQKIKESEEATAGPENCFCQKCYSCCPCLDLDKSVGCGRVWAIFRRATFNIVQHPYFNNFIFFIILLSSFALVFEDSYLDTRYTIGLILGILDLVVVLVFAVEMLLKWIGLGFNRYFRDGWCWLELIVLLGCILSMVAEPYFLPPPLLSLKALRPLRILSHIKGTRRSVVSLLKLMPSLIDVLLVTLTVWLFFNIMFVNLYAGKLYYCYNDTAEEYFEQADVNNRTECLILMMENFTEVRWKNVLFNFDNAVEAYHSLLSIATMKGWIDILYSVTDSRKVEDQPVYENSVYHYLCFVFFWIFGCFFCLIHILKVLFDAYSSQTKKMGGSHLFLTEMQMVNFNSLSFRTKRPLAPCPRPQGWLRGRLFGLVSRECFEWVMQGVIWFGVVLMMIERSDMESAEEEVHYWLQFVLVLIFLLEVILKLCAFGRSYFSDNLNTIDFVVLILQIINVFFRDLMERYFFPLDLLHLLRLGRVLRIIHRFPGALRLRLLFAAWTKSLRAIFNLALVLLVLMVTYASFGTFHFFMLRKDALISDLMNFETFFGGLLTMWTVVTWAGWDGIIIPALRTPPDCTPYTTPDFVTKFEPDEWDCSRSPALAKAFFISFLCLSSFVVLMMLLVLLVDMLNVFAQMRCDPLSAVNLSHFFKTWRKFATDSSHFIQRSQIPDLCDRLKKPLRIPKPGELELELSPEEQVHCRDVLLALSVQALGDGADRDALKARIDEKYHDFMPYRPSKENSCEMTNCAPQMNQEETVIPVTEETEE